MFIFDIVIEYPLDAIYHIEPQSVKWICNIGALMVNIEFMWRGLETGERRAFSESFHPFRAEPHTFYIYRQYTNIVFILQ
jgi:hypothetical protein